MTPNVPRDRQYDRASFRLSEAEHRYGPNFHLLSDPMLRTQLAQLCAETTTQPLINVLMESIYSALLRAVVNAEFPTRQEAIRTRMASHHPEGVLQGPGVDPETAVVSVNLARAGTLPSHVCYSALNYLLNPARVRQDHLGIARATNAAHQVTGSVVSGHKIGGTSDGAIVLIPDPMGATGGTLVETLDIYKKRGKALKFVAMHCIVTPEYLKNVWAKHPDLVVYAARLDRGLSPADVLETLPGTHWSRERGLNEQSYIVPGGGGFGEILNNAYV